MKLCSSFLRQCLISKGRITLHEKPHTKFDHPRKPCRNRFISEEVRYSVKNKIK